MTQTEIIEFIVWGSAVLLAAAMGLVLFVLVIRRQRRIADESNDAVTDCQSVKEWREWHPNEEL